MNWKRHILIFLVVFAAGAVVIPLLRGPRQGQMQNVPLAPRVDVRIDRWSVKVELADTPELREKGLRGRRALGRGHGMLFVNPERTRPRVEMSDVAMPLSIAFIAEDGTILQVTQTEPMQASVVAAEAPCTYVLQVRRGWFEDRGLKAGIRVELPAELGRRPPD